MSDMLHLNQENVKTLSANHDAVFFSGSLAEALCAKSRPETATRQSAKLSRSKYDNGTHMNERQVSGSGKERVNVRGWVFPTALV